MFSINTEKALKIILLFALINSSIFLGLKAPTGAIRLVIVFLMNISTILLIVYFFIIIKKMDAGFYFKMLYTLLILWSLYIIYVSFNLQSKTLISLFGHYLMGWAWLTPLAIVFGFNILNWIRLFDFFVKLLLLASLVAIGSFFYPLDVNFGIYEWMTFVPILLLTYVYQKRFNQRVALIGIVVFVAVSFFISQRANFLFLSIILSFSLIDYFLFFKASLLRKVFISLFIALGLMTLYFQMDSIFEEASQNKEISQNTRDFLFEELFNDMTESELRVGRGALGSYYSPFFASLEKQNIPGDAPIRVINEVGYLQMILKGGYTMVALYLLILLPVAFLGIFKSNNVIARMSGYLILSYLILWTISYYPVYSAEYILLWMAAGTAMSPGARSMKDSDIFNYKNERLEFGEV